MLQLFGLLHFFPLQLSETKIFTASSVASMPLPQENVTITKGQRSLMHFISLNNALQEIASPPPKRVQKTSALT